MVTRWLSSKRCQATLVLTQVRCKVANPTYHPSIKLALTQARIMMLSHMAKPNMRSPPPKISNTEPTALTRLTSHSMPPMTLITTHHPFPTPKSMVISNKEYLRRINNQLKCRKQRPKPLRPNTQRAGSATLDPTLEGVPKSALYFKYGKVPVNPGSPRVGPGGTSVLLM